MKPIALFLLLLVLNIPLQAARRVDEPVKLICRVTFYHGYEDSYGSKTALGGRAKEGETVAVDFQRIPPMSSVYISALDGVIGDGKFKAEDTGRHVVSRKAASSTAKRMFRSGDIDREEYDVLKNALVIDVYLSGGNRRMTQLADNTPLFLEVEINPQTAL